MYIHFDPSTSVCSLYVAREVISVDAIFTQYPSSVLARLTVPIQNHVHVTGVSGGTPRVAEASEATCIIHIRRMFTWYIELLLAIRVAKWPGTQHPRLGSEYQPLSYNNNRQTAVQRFEFSDMLRLEIIYNPHFRFYRREGIPFGKAWE